MRSAAIETPTSDASCRTLMLNSSQKRLESPYQLTSICSSYRASIIRNHASKSAEASMVRKERSAAHFASPLAKADEKSEEKWRRSDGSSTSEPRHACMLSRLGPLFPCAIVGEEALAPSACSLRVPKKQGTADSRLTTFSSPESWTMDDSRFRILLRASWLSTLPWMRLPPPAAVSLRPPRIE